MIAGYPLTGNTCVARGLRWLGYRIIHHPRKLEYIQYYDGACDLPVAYYLETLDKMYPGSRFIVPHRTDIEYYLKEEGDCKSRQGPMALRPPAVQAFARPMHEEMYGMVDDFDREVFKAKYLGYMEKVRTYFADRPADLLLFNVREGDGWEKLCSFMGHDIPDVPFFSPQWARV